MDMQFAAKEISRFMAKPEEQPGAELVFHWADPSASAMIGIRSRTKNVLAPTNTACTRSATIASKLPSQPNSSA
jgi:hypothetical protein